MSALSLNDTYDYTRFRLSDTNKYNSISEQLYREKKDSLEADRIERIDNRRKKSMETKKMFGNLEFGPVNSYHLSHLGIALKNAAGQSLSLQLDHINGINNDHRLENLRFLCPNCHSQTNTYAGKNKGR